MEQLDLIRRVLRQEADAPRNPPLVRKALGEALELLTQPMRAVRRANELAKLVLDFEDARIATLRKDVDDDLHLQLVAQAECARGWMTIRAADVLQGAD